MNGYIFGFLAAAMGLNVSGIVWADLLYGRAINSWLLLAMLGINFVALLAMTGNTKAFNSILLALANWLRERSRRR